MSLSERWAHQLASHGIITRDDEVLYSYGMRLGGLLLLNVATIISIGWLMEMIKESIVFMIVYIPLRRMAGGYHATTQLRCYFLGIVLTVGVLLAVKWLPWNMFSSNTMLMVASLAIIWLAPMEDKNKPLNHEEKEKYGMYTQYILLLEVAVYVGLVIVKQIEMAIVLTEAFIVLSILLILGKIIELKSKKHSVSQ